MRTSTTRDKNVAGKTWIIRILAVAFWISVWQLASMWLKQEILLASPVSVIKKLGELVVTADFWKSASFSFVRIVLGFMLGLMTGALLPVFSYLSSVASVLLKPLMTVVKSTPVASFIILCLIWIPSRNLSVFISFLMVLPVVYTNLYEGIRQTDRQLLEMADVFRVPLSRRIRYIYLSQILPFLRSGFSLSLGLCWKAGVAAEVIGIPDGSIGERLYESKVYLETPDLFAWTLVIVAVSILFEKCFLFLMDRAVALVEKL